MNLFENILVQTLRTKSKVKKIKIVDPACGSGAFLNKAANVLLEIHESIRGANYILKDTLRSCLGSY